MHESLNLFESVVSNKWLTRASIILFLNKKDLFENKIKSRPLSVCFPEYERKNSYETAAEFIKSKFESLIQRSQRQENQFYSHLTCATDSENTKLIINSVYFTITNNILDDIGLL